MPSFPHLLRTKQLEMHILIRNVLTLWTERTSFHMTVKPNTSVVLNLFWGSASCTFLWFVLHVATCENWVTCNQFFLLLWGGNSASWLYVAISSCSIFLCALFFIDSNTNQIAIYKAFFSFLMCPFIGYHLWLFLPWLLSSFHSLHFSYLSLQYYCFCLALC